MQEVGFKRLDLIDDRQGLGHDRIEIGLVNTATVLKGVVVNNADLLRCTSAREG